MEPKLLVSAIIPARNEEASIARAVESVAAQAEITQVIVVNDGSSDGTGAILAELAQRIPKLKVIEAGELPAGWVGKNHAAWVGAAEAAGEWLLFTDADTYHYLGSTRRALCDAVDHGAMLVSYSPEQELESFWERALIPMIYCRLESKFSFARVNDPDLPDAAANGQFVMILRDVYRAIGGHEAIAGEILEDVALARRVKRAGYGIYFTAPMGVVRTRMYRTLGAMWQGWTKNLYALMGGTPQGTLIELTEYVPWPEAVALGAIAAIHFLGGWRGTGAMLAPLLVGCVVGSLFTRHIQFGAALHRNLYPFSYIQYYIPGVCLYGAALLASWWKNTRGAVEWKGRAYPARTP
ncbi:MAG: glycosyltransferase family A protein [Candidatus Acidiferrales bacterium]